MAVEAPLSRTRYAGFSLLVGAVLLGVTETVHPDVPGDDIESLLVYAARQPGSWTRWALLLMLTALLLLPGVVALPRRVHGRGARLTVWGACVSAGGLVGLFAFAALNAQTVPLAGDRLPLSVDVVAAAERMEMDAGAGVVFLVALPGFHLGLPLLLWGLHRAGALPLWVAVLGTVGALGSIGADSLGGRWEAVTFWLLALALAATARLLLTTVDPEPARSGTRELRASST